MVYFLVVKNFILIVVELYRIYIIYINLKNKQKIKEIKNNEDQLNEYDLDVNTIDIRL